MRSEPSILRDFTVDRRVWLLSGVAIGIGACATVLAVLLLRCIALFTNLFYYHRLSTVGVSPAGSPLGYWMVVVPVLGGVLVGLMARFGSDKIRGHALVLTRSVGMEFLRLLKRFFFIVQRWIRRSLF